MKRLVNFQGISRYQKKNFHLDSDLEKKKKRLQFAWKENVASYLGPYSLALTDSHAQPSERKL